MSPVPRVDATAASPRTPSASRERALREALLPGTGYARLACVLREKESFNLDAYRATYLARRLNARLGAANVAPHEYPDRVARDPRERRALMEALGVNVTSFFRDPAAWEFLDEVALPEFLRARVQAGATGLRAASLGCAGGHEAYSLAMVLAELARDPALALPFTVDAFDVDPEALEAASEGVYAAGALATISEAALARYFRPTGTGDFQVAPSLRRRVHARKLDILTARLPGTYQVVLCRNVMIYLDAPAKEELLAKIGKALSAGGLLMIGQSELILGEASKTFSTLSPRHRIYKKVAA